MLIDLPGGHSAELVDPATATEGERRPLMAAYRVLGERLRPPPAPGRVLPEPGGSTDHLSAEELSDIIADFDREVVSFCVRAWDFPFPVTPQSVDDIPAVVYRPLRAQCEPILAELFPDPRDDDSPTSSSLIDRAADSYVKPAIVLPLLELPDWVHETKRLVSLIEFTHWTVAEIEATPAVVIDRLLAIIAARRKAEADEQKRSMERVN